MTVEPAEISMTNTKKEMLAAYNDLLARLEAEREAKARPEDKVEARAQAKAVEVANALPTDAVATQIAGLKSDVGRLLNDVSDKLESATSQYHQVQRAVEIKETELSEIYEIQKAASSLTALLEAQRERRDQFAAEMDAKREALAQEIAQQEAAWKQKQSEREAKEAEREAAGKQKREREAEEYAYATERERKLAREQFEYEKAKMERDIELGRDELEKDLSAREQAVAAREAELAELKAKAEGFPGALEKAVAEAVKKTSDDMKREASVREELLKREYQGQIDVLNSRIESARTTIDEQLQQIGRLSSQLDKSYGQVQDIATKAIEGSGRPPVVNVQSGKTESPTTRDRNGG